MFLGSAVGDSNIHDLFCRALQMNILPVKGNQNIGKAVMKALDKENAGKEGDFTRTVRQQYDHL